MQPGIPKASSLSWVSLISPEERWFTCQLASLPLQQQSTCATRQKRKLQLLRPTFPLFSWVQACSGSDGSALMPVVLWVQALSRLLLLQRQTQPPLQPVSAGCSWTLFEERNRLHLHS